MSQAIQTAVATAQAQWESWNDLGVSGRAQLLQRFANNLHNGSAQMALWQIDNAQRQIGDEMPLPGPTGEANVLLTAGRGLFVITADSNANETAVIGQLVTALIAGNVVILAGEPHNLHVSLHKLLTQAGLPAGVVQVLGADSPLETLIQRPELAGVAYCGNSRVAELNRLLAARDGNLAQLVAETDCAKMPTLGSPYYLHRFITERTRTTNTTAVGGNATLLELGGKED
ncbi:aldehyde dehydrogenase family protein [Marinobacterium arenosum]|uniref:aldehyde dehydrogenase family protein n=1 Tax=Marinobacterium arenosum TaxID=2862496 RepID=UPI001C97A5D6|nr:aldehyde dehydrogenase family protein [Marinobacterium arenosum]MBY4675572.1 aldehyde dehydrogenase family protein [Marinobacterium arenosum]